MSALTFHEGTTVITRIALAQVELLDHTGHVIRGLPRKRAKSLVARINEDRLAVGWKPLDMQGRWRR